jgi:hypothetical protein
VREKLGYHQVQGVAISGGGMDQVMSERRRTGAQAGRMQMEVGKALALQREVGTVAAVEHLKMVGAEGVLIARVLCGRELRAGDRDLAAS